MTTTQEIELSRVGDRIRGYILQFSREHPQEFHAEDLRRFVRRLDPAIAPGSPDRVLRAMRQRGELNYQIVNRSQSLYRFTPIPKRTP